MDINQTFERIFALYNSKGDPNAMMQSLKSMEIVTDDKHIFFMFDSNFQAQSFNPYLINIQEIYDFFDVKKEINFFYLIHNLFFHIKEVIYFLNIY